MEHVITAALQTASQRLQQPTENSSNEDFCPQCHEHMLDCECEDADE